MKTVGEVYAAIAETEAAILHCAPQELPIIRERLKILKWIVKDAKK